MSALTRIRPVSPRVKRWAGWFVAAGWDLDEVAALFSVSAYDLRQVLAGW